VVDSSIKLKKKNTHSVNPRNSKFFCCRARAGGGEEKKRSPLAQGGKVEVGHSSPSIGKKDGFLVPLSGQGKEENGLLSQRYRCDRA